MTDLSILDMLKQFLGFIPNLDSIVFGLGWIVILLSIVDYIIPASIDHDFTKKILNLPVIGKAIKFLARFSLKRSGLSVADDSILKDATNDKTEIK